MRTLLATILMALPSVVAISHGGDATCPSLNPVTVPLPDPVSGRQYKIYISLPGGYTDKPAKTFPLLVLADGGRAFPKLICDVRNLAQDAAIGDEPVVIGLSYAAGEDLEDSRRRDYTPVAQGPRGKAYGRAAAYQTYLRDMVLRHIENHYWRDPARRLFWGHSYGGLLGSHILLTEPGLFQTYLLGSPSFWFADQAIYGFEEAYAKRNKHLTAKVLLYVGGMEVSRYDSAHKGNTRDMVAGADFRLPPFGPPLCRPAPAFNRHTRKEPSQFGSSRLRLGLERSAASFVGRQSITAEDRQRRERVPAPSPRPLRLP